MKKTRGIVDPVTILVLAGVGLGIWFAPSIKSAFTKKPPVAQAQQADKALEEARAAAKAAQEELEALKKAEAAAKTAQVKNGQEMVAGAVEAIRRAPDSPEVRLTSTFLSRAEVALALANGKISEGERAQIVGIVNGYLSQVESERDAAVKALAERDAQLAAVSADRAQLAQRLPQVEKALESTSAKASAAEKLADAKRAEVIQWAKEKDAAERAASSFSARADELTWWIVIIAAGYAFIHYVLPNLAQEFPNSKILEKANKAAKSISSSHL